MAARGTAGGSKQRGARPPGAGEDGDHRVWAHAPAPGTVPATPRWRGRGPAPAPSPGTAAPRGREETEAAAAGGRRRWWGSVGETGWRGQSLAGGAGPSTAPLSPGRRGAPACPPRHRAPTAHRRRLPSASSAPSRLCGGGGGGARGLSPARRGPAAGRPAAGCPGGAPRPPPPPPAGTPSPCGAVPCRRWSRSPGTRRSPRPPASPATAAACGRCCCRPPSPPAAGQTGGQAAPGTPPRPPDARVSATPDGVPPRRAPAACWGGRGKGGQSRAVGTGGPRPRPAGRRSPWRAPGRAGLGDRCGTMPAN